MYRNCPSMIQTWTSMSSHAKPDKSDQSRYEKNRMNQRVRLSAEQIMKIEKYDDLIEEVEKLRAENTDLAVALRAWVPNHHELRKVKVEPVERPCDRI